MRRSIECEGRGEHERSDTAHICLTLSIPPTPSPLLPACCNQDGTAFVTITGEMGKSEELQLYDCSLERGKTDTFSFVCKELGEMKQVKLGLVSGLSEIPSL